MGDWDQFVLGDIKHWVVGQVWILDGSGMIPPLHSLADLLQLTSESVPVFTLVLPAL